MQVFERLDGTLVVQLASWSVGGSGLSGGKGEERESGARPPRVRRIGPRLATLRQGERCTENERSIA